MNKTEIQEVDLRTHLELEIGGNYVDRQLGTVAEPGGTGDKDRGSMVRNHREAMQQNRKTSTITGSA